MIQANKKTKLKSESLILDKVPVLIIYRLEVKQSNVDVNYKAIILN